MKITLGRYFHILKTIIYGYINDIYATMYNIIILVNFILMEDTVELHLPNHYVYTPFSVHANKVIILWRENICRYNLSQITSNFIKN